MRLCAGPLTLSNRSDQELAGIVLHRLEERPGAPVSILQLLRMLGLPNNSRRRLRRLLQGLVREGRVVVSGRGRYELARDRTEIEGLLVREKRGGVAVQGAHGEVLLRLPANDRGGARPGDRVRAVVLHHNRLSQPEGRVIEILARGRLPVVGTVHRQGRSVFVFPDDAEGMGSITMDPRDVAEVDDGVVVVVQVNDPTLRSRPQGTILQVLGVAGQLPTERARLLFLHSLSASFSEQVQSEARAVSDCNAGRRRDLRSVVHVTIDPRDAKDFDDAVALERRPDGYRLLVSIADVASFVKDGGAIDCEGLRRGTSVYLPGTCFPMLPARLSEDVCSLSPGVDKATLTVELLLDRKGCVRGGSIFRSLIRSAMRMTYEQVQALLDGAGDPAVPREIRELVRGLADCAHGLLTAMAERGSLDLDLPESEIVLDTDGRPTQIAPKVRLFSHRIIEASMIAANEAVGRMLWRAKAPTLFRVHPPPDPERMQAFAPIAAALGAPVSFGENPTASQLAAYIESLSGKPARGVLQQLLLRSLMQARYSTTREGHFGLGATCYVHFTSPIRRYPDLMVHRQIGALIDSRYPEGLLLDDEPPRAGSFPVNAERASAMAESCSNAERRAMEAERQATALYQAAFLQQHLGEEFAGTIVYVTEFGFFVRIEPSGIEGLVHIARLSDDYYRFAEERLALYGSHTGKEFRVGMPVTVRVETVDLRLRQIDFQLMEVST
jgi:ribonuclease R